MDPDNQNPTQPTQPVPIVSSPTVNPQEIPTAPQPIAPVMQDAPKPKSNLLSLLAIFLVLATLGAGGYWVYKNYYVKPEIKPQPTLEAIIPTPVATENPTANWKTYTNTKLGFSLKYPPELKPSANDSFVNIDNNNQYMSIYKNFIGGWMGKEFSKEIINIDNEEGTISLWLLCDNWETTECLKTINLENYDDASLKVVFTHKGDKWYIFGPSWKKDGANITVQTDKLNQILSTFKFTDQAEAASTKKIGYIKSITPNYDNYCIEVDYIDFNQDNSAPNGYRIENPSKETVKLPTDLPGNEPKVIMQTYSLASNGNFNFNQTITFSEFSNAFETNTSIKNAPYWIETKNGNITKITEQYIP